MPTVPIPEQSVAPQGLPDTRLNPSLPSGAFGGFQQTSQMTDRLATLFEEEKKQADQASVLEADLILSNLSTKIEQDAKTQYQGKNALLAGDYVRSEFMKYAQDLQSGMANDEQKQAVGLRILSQYTSLNGKIQNYANQERTQFETNAKDAWVSDGINSIKDNFQDPNFIDGKVAETTGVIKKFYNLRGQDPAVADAEISKFKKEAYKMAADGVKDHMIYLIDNHIVRDEKGNVVVDNSGKLTDLVSQLTDTKSGKYTYFPYLSSDDRHKMLDGISQANKEARSQHEQDVKDNQNKVGNDFFHKLMFGTLTATEIDKSSLNPTGENSKRSWLEAVTAKSKISGDIKTDETIKGDLLYRIITDPTKISNQDILQQMVDKKLSPTDAGILTQKREERLALKPDPAATAVHENLLVDRKAGYLLDPSFDGDSQAKDQESSRRHIDLVNSFDEWRKQNPGKNPADWYKDTVIPIVDQNKKGLFMHFLDSLFSMGGEPFKATTPIQKPDPYETGKTYVDATGRKATYLGGGKWQTLK